MGLDAMDIAFRLEKRLGIIIPPTEGHAFASTVENLHRYLMDKLNGVDRDLPVLWPVAKKVWVALRKSSSWWRCGNNWEDLNKHFNPEQRVEIWRALETELNIKLPDLEYSSNEPYPNIPRIGDSAISLMLWIAEHDPNRVKWVKLSCERSGKMADRNWSEDEVWEILLESLVDGLGVDAEAVTPDARLVEDLGME
jgi:acyl carrier protein